MRHGHVSRRSHSGMDTSPVPTLEHIGPHEWNSPSRASVAHSPVVTRSIKQHVGPVVCGSHGR
jgi:hypothetical protein